MLNKEFNLNINQLHMHIFINHLTKEFATEELPEIHSLYDPLFCHSFMSILFPAVGLLH